MNSPWLVEQPCLGRPTARLFCFHYAGGTASAFHRWNASLPRGVEVQAVQLPGRETHHHRPPLDNVHNVVEALLPVLKPCLALPFAFFGHSMGALVAFETARALRQSLLLQPSICFFSARMAPHVSRNTRFHAFSDQALVQEVRRFGGTPDEVLADRELMEVLLPILRADFAITENYSHRPAPPLACPIVALGGVDDKSLAREDILGWQQHTASTFQAQFFAGGHFFIRSSREEVLRRVSRDLIRTFPWLAANEAEPARTGLEQ